MYGPQHKAASDLIRAIEALHPLEVYQRLLSTPVFTVDINWLQGAGVAGYGSVRHDVGKLVARDLRKYIDEAVENARSVVADAQATIRDAMPDSPGN